MLTEDKITKASIIATGASLKGVDLNKIEGYKIAVNHAWKYVDYDLLMAFDNPVEHGFPVDGRLHTNAMWIDQHKLEGCWGWYRHRRNTGIIRKGRGIFGGSGSLFCGINVALKLGIKELDIYGADMELTDGYCHFYDTEPVKERKLITHYNNSFERHKKTKEIFMDQLIDGENINWICSQTLK